MPISSPSLIITPYSTGATFPADLTISTNTTLASVTGPRWVLVTGACDITLPPAADDEQCEFLILNVNGSAINVIPDGTEEVNGAAGTVALSAAYGVLRLKSNGVDGWYSPTEVVP